MEIVIVIFLLVIVSIFLYLSFRLIKWIFDTKTRRVWVVSLIAVLILVTIINTIFFEKMEFIQSKVYPRLYIIKNPISDKDSLSKVIKKIVIQEMNTHFVGNEEKHRNKYSEISIPKLKYSMLFYEYYKGWGSNPIGEAGTAHFIENKEDPGGFSSELLEYYKTYQIALFNVSYCKNDTVSYFGNLKHYKDGSVIKIDTIINLCQKNK